MGSPGFPRRTVEDAAIDLIEAAGNLAHVRAETARIAAALEARWAASRTRAIESLGRGRPDSNDLTGGHDRVRILQGEYPPTEEKTRLVLD